MFADENNIPGIIIRGTFQEAIITNKPKSHIYLIAYDDNYMNHDQIISSQQARI